MQKLNEREAKSIKAMQESVVVEKWSLWDFFKHSYPTHKNVPCIGNRVEVRLNEKCGRGVYLKKDLKAGEIIAIKESMFHYLHKENALKCCCNCFKTNAMKLIFCDYLGKLFHVLLRRLQEKDL